MKRKIISTLLCVSMCAALMMGCGQSDKSDTKENKKTEESKDEAKDEIKDKVKELNPKVFDELNESLAAFVGIESNPIKKTKDILFQA